MTNKEEKLLPSKEILPCRCGNDDVMVVGVTGHKFTCILYYEIECGKCKFFMRLPTEAEVIQAWNISMADQKDKQQAQPSDDLVEKVARAIVGEIDRIA